MHTHAFNSPLRSSFKLWSWLKPFAVVSPSILFWDPHGGQSGIEFFKRGVARPSILFWDPRRLWQWALVHLERGSFNSPLRSSDGSVPGIRLDCNPWLPSILLWDPHRWFVSRAPTWRGRAILQFSFEILDCWSWHQCPLWPAEASILLWDPPPLPRYVINLNELKFSFNSPLRSSAVRIDDKTKFFNFSLKFSFEILIKYIFSVLPALATVLQFSFEILWITTSLFKPLIPHGWGLQFSFEIFWFFWFFRVF